jgi:hypothetical protein
LSGKSGHAAATLNSITQGVLASDLANFANQLVQSAVNGPATIYDRAMDANFIETGIGGSYHRLFDGGHTISGAFSAARDASPDDTLVQESLGAMLGLLKDASTPRGLPLANWNQETFNQVAHFLEANFHIPKSWFADLNTYSASELLGCAIGAVAIIFSWNRADTEKFNKLVGGIALSAALGANPMLMLIAVVAFARSFETARRSGQIAELVDGQARGGLIAGTSIAAITAVGIGGGPAGLALLVAVVAGVLTDNASKRLSVIRVGRTVRSRMRVLPDRLVQLIAVVAGKSAGILSKRRRIIRIGGIVRELAALSCRTVRTDRAPNLQSRVEFESKLHLP